MTVLVADDNGTNRKLCRALLAVDGYAVREATDGEEVLAIVRSELPELILLDVQMPVKNGVETLRELKSDPAARGIPVVALTSYAMKGDRERFLGEGFSDYLPKPIDIDRFLETVRRLAPHPAAPPPGYVI